MIYEGEVSLGKEDYCFTYLRDKACRKFVSKLSTIKIPKKSLWGIDIETYAQKKYKGDKDAGLLCVKSKIRTIQIFNGEQAYILDLLGSNGEYLLADSEFVSALFTFLQHVQLIAHNAIFETQHLQRIAHLHGILKPLNIYCTMNAYRLIMQSVSYSESAWKKAGLAEVAKQVLRVSIPKDMQVSDWSNPTLSEEQIEYCARDAALPFLIFEVIKEDIDEKGMRDVYEVNTRAQEVVAHMNLHGVNIDVKRHEKMMEEWKDNCEKYSEECFYLLNDGKGMINHEDLKALCTDKVVKAYKDVVWNRSLFSKGRPRLSTFLDERNRFLEASEMLSEVIKKSGDKKHPKKGLQRALGRFGKNLKNYLVDAGSSKQLSDWLKANVDTSEWPVSEKSGNLKTDEESFLEYEDLEIIAPLVKFKKNTKLYSTYGVGLKKYFVEHTEPYGTRVAVHPNLSLCYTETGRMSSFSPNLQNIPRDKELRKLFIPRGKDYRLLVADFSQIEIRVFAYVSGDSVMKNAYAKGVDIHSMTATAICGKTEKQMSKEEWEVARYHAKAINFCMLFGGGPPTVKRYAKKTYKVDMEIEQAEEAVENFREMYAESREWQLEHTSECEMSLEVRTPLGKLRKLNPDTYYTVCLNTPIQGGAAEIMLLSMINVYKSIRKSGIDAHISNVVHDEILVDCHIDSVEEMAAYIKDGMEKALLTVFPEASLTGLVDVGVGKNWAEAKSKENRIDLWLKKEER